MKVAIVHELLTQLGGAERVLEVILKLYPEADVFTTIYNEKKVGSVFNKYNIKTSFLQNYPFAKDKFRWYLPLMLRAIESFDLTKYDLVISDASAFAKGAITLPETPHICYMHTPTRYLWTDTHSYVKTAKIPWPASLLLPYVLNYQRTWDYTAGQRPDYIIANSRYIKNRIKKYYRRDSDVVYPFVQDQNFRFSDQKNEYYLMGGRLVPYKRYDIAIRAFNKLKDKKLIITGDHPIHASDLKDLVKSKNIEFLGRVSDEKLIDLYSKAKGYIFTAKEDFGITPLEAMVSGTPVIAFGEGGATETVIEGVSGMFFSKQDPKDLIKTIGKFEKTKFDCKKVREQGMKFSQKTFEENFKKSIDKYIKDYNKKEQQ